MRTFTMITPLYHGEKYIYNLLKSAERRTQVLKKRYPDAEVEYILVNDSPDKAIKIETDNFSFKLVIVENEKNSGIHFSRVNGLKNSKGEYVLFLDQDDELDDNVLLSHYEKMGKADVVVGNGYRVTSNNKYKIYKTNLALYMSKYYSCYLWGTDMILSPGQCLIRRASIPVKWYEKILTVNGCDDFYLWILMFKNNAKFVVNSETVYAHMEIDENFSGDFSKMDQSFIAMCKLLQSEKIITEKENSILETRLQLRRKWKQEHSLLGKISLFLGNIRIMGMTCLYKLAGYQ